MFKNRKKLVSIHSLDSKKKQQFLTVFFNPNKAVLFEGSCFWGGGSI